MENKKPSYYSILTADVRYDNRLKANEKLLFSEITALANKNGYCSAGNSYFANLYTVNKSTVSRWVSHLERLGYVHVVQNRSGKEITSRFIYPVATPLLTKKSIGYGQKNQYPIDEKVKGNNTSINNTSINNNLLSVSQAKHDDTPLAGQTISLVDDCKEIVDYLNQKTGSQYRATTPNTKSLIKARIKEGFTPADFKKVIDNKVADWGNDERMKVYLRPVTLFGTKFESYLNEHPKNVKSDDDLPDYLKMF